MSRASALARAQGLKSALLAAGVPQVSIELVEGRPISGVDRWDALQVKTNFTHHIVSRYGSNKTPGLALIKRGRSDLPGPLCNGYGGFDLVARIICMGLANHPGAGGPITVNGFRIPKDSARRYAFGWEFEGGIDPADWNRILTNPATGKQMNFHEFMARCSAGAQNYFRLPVTANLEHSTWTPRKIDRLGYTQASGVAAIKRYSSKPPTGSKPVPSPEEDVALTQAEINAVATAAANAVWAKVLGNPDIGQSSAADCIIKARLHAEGASTEQAKITDQLDRIEADTDRIP